MYEFTAQCIGIVAMAFNILSYQMKASRRVVIMQLFGGALFSVNFFMLGAYVGAILNLVATFRAIVYSNREKFKAGSIYWLILFIILYIASYALSFTVFGRELTPYNTIIELLPVIAMTATTLGFRSDKASVIRKFSLISSPCWLIYNIAFFSVGAIICEAVSIVSIIVGIFRHDVGKAYAQDEK